MTTQSSKHDQKIKFNPEKSVHIEEYDLHDIRIKQLELSEREDNVTSKKKWNRLLFVLVTLMLIFVSIGYIYSFHLVYLGKMSSKIFGIITCWMLSHVSILTGLVIRALYKKH